MKFLGEIRQKRGLTQAALAEMVGIGVNSIARYERGEITPSITIAHAIADALHVTEAELLNGPESKEIRITLHFSEMPKESEIDMNGNEFDLYMPGNGSLGIKGAAKFSCLEDIDNFLARAKEQLVKGFDFQKDRGALPATA